MTKTKIFLIKLAFIELLGKTNEKRVLCVILKSFQEFCNDLKLFGIWF